jgi:aminopeptidase N
MWFGNLVTMRWFEDAWLSESFADHMGFLVANQAAGFPDTWVDFSAGHLPLAYEADERRSAHPVAAEAHDVPDLDSAYGNFDSISYAKGNAVVRQLVAWLGEEDFMAGVNTYLTRHRFSSASLADFTRALGQASGRDVQAWVEAWLRTTGFDTVTVSRDGGVPVVSRTGSRPHRLRVSVYEDTDHGLRPAGIRMVDLAEAPVPLPEGRDRVVVADSGGDTFARLRLDESSLHAVQAGLSSVPEPATRAVLWTMLGDLVRCAELDPWDYLALVGRHLPAEHHAAVFQAVLDRARQVLIRCLPAERVTAAVDLLAVTCVAALENAQDDSLSLAATRGLAATSRDSALLGSWLAEDRTHTGTPLDPRLRWDVVRRLAETGAPNAAALVGVERDRDPSSTGGLGAARALAALPDAAAKAGAWQVMFAGKPSNRLFTWTAEGFWSPEQVDLLSPYVARYVEQAPALAARSGQAFSTIVGRAFPAIPLGADALALLDQALAGDVPTVLRRVWEDRRDDLAAAVAVRERFG